MKTNNKTQETKPSNPKSKTAQKENTPFAESVVLKPVGYPFDFAMMENNLEIIDKTLFEEYAREQWLGLVVKENSYLFDQKISTDSCGIITFCIFGMRGIANFIVRFHTLFI